MTNDEKQACTFGAIVRLYSSILRKQAGTSDIVGSCECVLTSVRHKTVFLVANLQQSLPLLIETRIVLWKPENVCILIHLVRQMVRIGIKRIRIVDVQKQALLIL